MYQFLVAGRSEPADVAGEAVRRGDHGEAFGRLV